MKPPRKPTLDRLKASALAYLTRYAASRAMLRAVLVRRVTRWARATGAEAEAIAEAMRAVDEAVATSVRAGLVDDARFAGARTATLVRKGWPARRIKAALSQKGIDGVTAAAAVEAAATDDAAAARRFAERRRLGPWRAAERRAERREKDIAALMRAGFSLSHARAAVDGAADAP
ncbi:MAG: RecX family transcriptional regulator [Micropepsaceae bacterium]